MLIKRVVINSSPLHLHKSCTSAISQGFKPLANSESPLKWTEENMLYAVGFIRLSLLGGELIPRQVMRINARFLSEMYIVALYSSYYSWDKSYKA